MTFQWDFFHYERQNLSSNISGVKLSGKIAAARRQKLNFILKRMVQKAFLPRGGKVQFPSYVMPLCGHVCYGIDAVKYHYLYSPLVFYNGENKTIIYLQHLFYCDDLAEFSKG